MRQLTTLQDEAAAQRFAAWLVTQKIEAHAEQDRDAWAVWVRDEDQLATAKEHLATFLAEPNDPRYRNALSQAAAVLREEQQKRERAQKNMVDMSRTWGRGLGSPRSQPLVLAFIVASIVVAVFTDFGAQEGPGLVALLQISGGNVDAKDGMVRLRYVWQEVQQGQLWRLVTPIFLHFGLMHIIFNMMVLYDFGGQIESRIKSGWFLLLVIVIACVSNVSQVLLDSFLEGTTDYPRVGAFGGMSGVNYGLFGFIYIRSSVLRDSSYLLRPETTVIMFIWLIFCMVRNYLPAGDLPYVANTAHVSGLLTGMAIAYAPRLFGSRPGRLT